MKSRTILGLMSLIVFTGCGKNMQMTLNPVTSTASNRAISLAKTGIFDNKLSNLSELDLKSAKGLYPFINASDQSSKVRALGSFPFSYGKDKLAHGFIKESNLVFRAIKQIPPMAAITSIDLLELHLRGVRLTLKSDAVKADFSKQVLCVLNTRLCTNEAPSDTLDEKANLSQEFWADRPMLASTPDKPFKNIADFKLETQLGDGTSVYAYSPVATLAITDPALPNGKIQNSSTEDKPVELVINLKEVFGLKDDQAAKQWIMDNSSEFADGAYRKFQFVMGNNLYAEEGEMVLTTTLDLSKMPKNFASQIGALKNGDIDLAKEHKLRAPVNYQTDFLLPSPLKVQKEMSLDIFEGTTSKLTSAGVVNLKAIAVRVKNDANLIEKIEIGSIYCKNSNQDERISAIAAELMKDGLDKMPIEMVKIANPDDKVFLSIHFASGDSLAKSQDAVKCLTDDLLLSPSLKAVSSN